MFHLKRSVCFFYTSQFQNALENLKGELPVILCNSMLGVTNNSQCPDLRDTKMSKDCAGTAAGTVSVF